MTDPPRSQAPPHDATRVTGETASHTAPRDPLNNEPPHRDPFHRDLPPHDPRTGAGFTPVETVPVVHRLQTRLALLILVVVAVLAGATAIQLTRAFEQARVGVVQLSRPAAGTAIGPALPGTTAPGATNPGTSTPPPLDLRAIVRSTLINLAAVFLFTLVGATLFSRRLLTEPIAELVRGTRELAAGRLGVTLPVTSRSELGLLAEAFNHMSAELAESLELLERRVRERTADLTALLELSNSTALTLELGPMLDQILERLEAAVGCSGATVYEPLPGGEARRVAGRGVEPPADPALLARALASREPLEADAVADAVADAQAGAPTGAPAHTPSRAPAHAPAPRLLAVPMVVRDAVVGVLLVTRAPAEDPAAGPGTGPGTSARNPGRNTDPGTDPGIERRQLTIAFANQLGVALENARLYQRVQERAALEERQHLARELHDSVSQALYAILLGTHTAQRRLGESPDDARQALDYVENLAQAGIKEMRALIFVLRPESLENEGLIGVLRKQLDVMETRHGIDATLDAPAEPDAPFATKQALYRIAQEALHNVVKHARAAHVRVTLTTRDGRVGLTVADDGVGFDPGGDVGASGPRARRRRSPGVAVHAGARASDPRHARHRQPPGRGHHPHRRRALRRRRARNAGRSRPWRGVARRPPSAWCSSPPACWRWPRAAPRWAPCRT